MGGLFRCALFCGVAVVLGVAFMRFVGVNPPSVAYTTASETYTDVQPHEWDQAAGLVGVHTYHGFEPYAYTHPTTWQSFLTTPIFQTEPAAAWFNGGRSPFLDVAYGFRNVLSIPVVFFVLLGLIAAFLTRRRGGRKSNPSRSEVSPGALAKARHQAATIDRMHGIMDRIESRVERLESALLP